MLARMVLHLESKTNSRLSPAKYDKWRIADVALRFSGFPHFHEAVETAVS